MVGPDGGKGRVVVSDETQEWFRGLVRDTQDRMVALTRLREDPERFQGRVERDGVAVVVAPGGNLVDLTLTPAALRLGPDDLAALIKDNQQAALRQANERYASAVQDAAGRAVDVTALVEQRLDTAGLREAAAGLREYER